MLTPGINPLGVGYQELLGRGLGARVLPGMPTHKEECTDRAGPESLTKRWLYRAQGLARMAGPPRSCGGC